MGVPPPLNLHPADVGLVIAYLIAMLGVGWGFRRADRSTEGWFLAGRTLTLPAFVATLVATWYGGILGVGEAAHGSGLAMISMFGVPYYLCAIGFALWLAPRIREAALFTIPDKLAERFGRPAGLVGAVYVWLMANPAPYVLMCGQLLGMIFGWPPFVSLVLGLIVSTVYVYTGGFRADVRVNIAQFALMYLGFAVLTGFCLARWPLGWMAAHVPPELFRWHGGQDQAYVLSWFFIALWTFVDPGFHQRCYAASTPQVAQRGVLVSVLFWLLFDAMTVTCGLYARAALPDIPPLDAFPRLGDALLPPAIKGLFFVAMLATVMSTLVSYTFLCGTTFARDVMWRLRGGDDAARRWGPLGLLLTSVIALILAWLLPSVVGLWYAIGAVFVPGLLLPVLLAYAPRARLPAGAALASLLASSGTALVWLVLGLRAAVDGSPAYPGGVPPVYPGVAVSLLVCGAGLAIGARPARAPRRPRRSRRGR